MRGRVNGPSAHRVRDTRAGHHRHDLPHTGQELRVLGVHRRVPALEPGADRHRRADRPAGAGPARAPGHRRERTPGSARWSGTPTRCTGRSRPSCGQRRRRTRPGSHHRESWYEAGVRPGLARDPLTSASTGHRRSGSGNEMWSNFPSWTDTQPGHYAWQGFLDLGGTELFATASRSAGTATTARGSGTSLRRPADYELVYDMARWQRSGYSWQSAVVGADPVAVPVPGERYGDLAAAAVPGLRPGGGRQRPGAAGRGVRDRHRASNPVPGTRRARSRRRRRGRRTTRARPGRRCRCGWSAACRSRPWTTCPRRRMGSSR